MKIIYCIILSIVLTAKLFAQVFEIRTVNKGSGEIGVEIRETSGINTPTTSSKVTDIKFGIKWLNSYNVDLNSFLTTNYNIEKSGTRQLSGIYHFQAFFANSTPYNIPTNWVEDGWNEIMSINNNMAGVGNGTFEICEVGFDLSTNPNIGIDLIDYTPTINGSATNVPLPVELTSFTASVNGEIVNLKWQTATEVDNYGFDIERRVNNPQSTVRSQWEKIGFVKGAGNSNSPKNYSFTDKNLTGGTKFKYRLKQIDTDGKFEYSNEEEVEIIPVEYSLSQNYPNPFNPVTSIKFELPQAAKVTLNVYNILGERVGNLVNENLEAGFHSVPFNASALPSGTYIYRLQADKFVQTKKMILLK